MSNRQKPTSRKPLSTLETLEELVGEGDVIDMDEFKPKNLEGKLEAIVRSLNKIHAKYDILTDAICHETEGIKAKVVHIQEETKEIMLQVPRYGKL